MEVKENDESIEEMLRVKEGAYLVWEDLSVVANNFTMKKLINGLSGCAQPNRIMAIMGPSGSGKSILLDSLAGRLSPSLIMTGNILFNGKQGSQGSRDISYVTQEEFFIGTLTVQETLTYSAHLRLPSTMTNNEINTVVSKTINKMGLQHCSDNKIGNWYWRGISSGEKRRLSIGLEILTQPSVMFLDEPTTGLDSASAFYILGTLKNIAQDGRIVVCSIHQPSSYIFDLIDDLCLLSNGETIYFGEAKMAVKFFAEAGFPCPARRNPSDHFLRCINSDFDKIATLLVQSQSHCEHLALSNSSMNITTKDIRAMLIEKYRSSEYATSLRKKIQEAALIEEHVTITNRTNTSWWKQLCILSQRSLLNMSSDIGYYWLRILFYILVSLCAGHIYFDVGLSSSAILARARCDAFIYGFLICLSVGGLPFFIEEWKVSYRERLNGHYGEVVFALSNFLSSFPFLVMIALSSGTIVYYMVKFHPGFSHYSFFCINLFCCISIMESCMMIVALLVPNALMGVGVSAAIIMLLMMASAIFKLRADLPKVFWLYPMSYISFTSWAIQGQYKNDMIGIEFDPLVPGEPKLQGEKVLKIIFGMELNHSKWWDLAALLILLLVHRLLFFVVLKYKERASFVLRRIYYTGILQHLCKTSLLTSAKHQPYYPSSSSS